MKTRIILMVLSVGLLLLTACNKSSTLENHILRRLTAIEDRLDLVEGRSIRVETTNTLYWAELANEEVLQVSSNLLAMQTKFGQLEADHTALKGQVLALNIAAHDHAQIIRRLAEMKADYTELISRLTALETTTNTTHQRLAELQADHTALKTQVLALNTVADDQTQIIQRLAEMKADHTVLKGQVLAVTNNQTQMIQRLAEMKTAHTDRLAVLETETKQIIQRLAALETNNSTAVEILQWKWLTK